MSEYIKTNWQAGVTPLSADNLNNLETQHEKILDIMTTRGDMIYRNASTWGRLAKGVKNQILRQGDDDPYWDNETPPPHLIIPNSADPGVERWCLPGWYITAPAEGVTPNKYICYIPIYIPRRMIFDRLGIYVIAASTPPDTASARMGLYALNSIGQPGDLIVDAGKVNLDTTGTKAAVIDVTLEPGFYYIAFVASWTGNYPRLSMADSTKPIIPPASGTYSAPTFLQYIIAASALFEASVPFVDNPVITNYTAGAIHYGAVVKLREVIS